jgi:uncharacterized membrane protein
MAGRHKKTQEADATASAFFAVTDRTDPPLFAVTLRPHRSLPIKGFVWLIAITATLMTIPLWPLLGTLAFLGILPFMLLALGLLWYFFQRNYHDATVREELRLWPDLIAVHRYNPRGKDAYWQANPYWVKLTLYKDQKIENYLTLTGDNREIELGAFLSSEERLALHEQLRTALAKCRADHHR